MSLCTSIDTLAMAYLDDELAGEERRELELHLHDCAACRAQVDGEREELAMLRGKLAAPPAPDLLRARVARALDAEDAAATRAQRRRWSSWFLPGSAALAGAAALAVFVTAITSSGPTAPGAVAQEAVRQHTRSMPLEVQGASTGPWLREHFTPSVNPPRFQSPGIRLVGARLTAVDGHDGALLSYDVQSGGARFGLTALVVREVRGDEMTGGQEVQIYGRTLHVMQANGHTAVTFVSSDDHMGYAFMSDRLSSDELLRLVVSTDLIGRVQQGR